MELLADANKRLRFMRSLVPKHLQPDFREAPQEGHQTFVVRDGKVEDGRAAMKEGARYSTFGAGNMDPDDVARHNHQMKRFNFMDRPGGPPTGPVWE